MISNNPKSLANKTTNFVNESHLLIWGKLQLRLTRQRHENRLYIHFLVQILLTLSFGFFLHVELATSLFASLTSG